MSRTTATTVASDAPASEPTIADRIAALTPNESTVAKYRAGSRSVKMTIRSLVQNAMNDAVMRGDIIAANQHRVTLAACTTTTEKTAPNYGDILARRVATLRYAADLIESGAVIPDGMPDDVACGVVSGDTFVAVVADANAMASAKITRSARHDIDGVFDRAFDGMPSGSFLTVAEIAARGAIDDYRPSNGAVAARLFPRSGNACTLVGYTPVAATATTPVGARND